MSDLNATIARLVRGQSSFELSTTDLCFLLALRHRAEMDSLASFDEEVLIDVFLQVCEVTEPGADNPRKRATHAIQRLREQRFLARVDGAGIVRAGEYAMTRLASGVAEFFLAEEALTKESLSLLTTTLVAQLAQVKVAARKARTAEDWRSKVVEALRVTVAELVGGIERRQRGLDSQQEEVRERVGALLQKGWFDTVSTCEQLLDQTSATLRELNEVLLRDTSHLLALLQEIEEAAEAGSAPEAEAAAQRVAEHVERVGAWGGARLRAWSDYYQYVHRYLSDVVRLDPERALSQRLRDSILGWVDRPFSFALADAPSIRLLRELGDRVERPPVTRPRRDREQPIAELPIGPSADDLEARVKALLARGAASLSAVLTDVLPEVSQEERFRAAGRVTGLVGAEARVRSARERDWVGVPGEIEVEEWTLLPPRRSR